MYTLRNRHGFPSFCVQPVTRQLMSNFFYDTGKKEHTYPKEFLMAQRERLLAASVAGDGTVTDVIPLEPEVFESSRHRLCFGTQLIVRPLWGYRKTLDKCSSTKWCAPRMVALYWPYATWSKRIGKRAMRSKK